MTNPQANDPPSPNYLWWNIAAGLFFGLSVVVAAPFAGLEISGLLGNSEGLVTWLTLFLGVFLMGCLFWWLIMSRPQRFSLARGAITGVLVAFFSYPVVLTLAEIFQRNLSDDAKIGAFGYRLSSLALTIGLTLMTTGFAAIVFLAIIGMAATWILIRIHPGTAAIVAQRAQRKNGLIRLLTKVALAFAFVIFVFFAASFAWLSFRPVDISGLAFNPSASIPAKTYDEAMTAFQSVQTKEAGLPLLDRCRSTLLTHGNKTARVLVYFHGLTSCPAQADEVANKFYEMGYNVYLPRMFGHGEIDPMTLSMVDLKAEDLVQLANDSLDMAQGLGDDVIVVGLSVGGTIASWVGQYRADVDTSIAVSPFFGPYVVPAWAMHAANNLMLMMPNVMMWWNPLETVRPPQMSYAYARYATHALAQAMRLGRAVETSARTDPPAAKHVGMLLNEADVAVSREFAQRIITSWQGHGANVTVKVLPFSRRLPHDLLDAREPFGDVNLVYATLVYMINAVHE